MTTKHIFSPSLTAFSAIAALATGIALTAAPSTARAETASQIVMSGGNVDCPPCRLLKVRDQAGMSFHDVAIEVEDGNQIVITADVTVADTAGKPRTGTIVFSAASVDSRFMDYRDDACDFSLTNRQAGDQACAAVSGALREASTAAATAPTLSPFVPSTPDAAGIIMRDGGVCDPIRHMGC
jgi:hypothetical protein